MDPFSIAVIIALIVCGTGMLVSAIYGWVIRRRKQKQLRETLPGVKIEDYEFAMNILIEKADLYAWVLNNKPLVPQVSLEYHERVRHLLDCARILKEAQYGRKK